MAIFEDASWARERDCYARQEDAARTASDYDISEHTASSPSVAVAWTVIGVIFLMLRGLSPSLAGIWAAAFRVEGRCPSPALRRASF